MSDQPLIPQQIIARPLPLAGVGLGVLPGLALCAGVMAAAYGLEAGEAHLFGRAWLEALVLAILAMAALGLGLGLA